MGTFNLSNEGIEEFEQEVDGENHIVQFNETMYPKSKIREFIRKLKDGIELTNVEELNKKQRKIINKLAGSSLCR